MDVRTSEECTVVVTNVPAGTNEEYLRDQFTKYGVIKRIRIEGPRRDRGQQSRDLIVRIIFEEPSAVQCAIDDLSGSLRIWDPQRAKSRLARLRRSTSPPHRDLIPPCEASALATAEPTSGADIYRNLAELQSTASYTLTPNSSPRQTPALPLLLSVCVPDVPMPAGLPTVHLLDSNASVETVAASVNVQEQQSRFERGSALLTQFVDQIRGTDAEELIPLAENLQLEFKRRCGYRGSWVLFGFNRLAALAESAGLRRTWHCIVEVLRLTPARVLVLAPSRIELLPCIKDEVKCIRRLVGSEHCKVCHSLRDMREQLKASEFNVVHIAGDCSQHGLARVLEVSDDGPIAENDILCVFDGARLRPSVVLNCCRTLPLARQLVAHRRVDYAVGHALDVHDENALEFARRLYESWTKHGSLLSAFCHVQSTANEQTATRWWEGNPACEVPRLNPFISSHASHGFRKRTGALTKLLACFSISIALSLAFVFSPLWQNRKDVPLPNLTSECDCSFRDIASDFAATCNFNKAAVPIGCLQTISEVAEKLKRTPTGNCVQFGKRDKERQLLKVVDLLDGFSAPQLNQSQKVALAEVTRVFAGIAHAQADVYNALRLFNRSAELCTQISTHAGRQCMGESLDYIGHLMLRYYKDPHEALTYFQRASKSYAGAATDEQLMDLEESLGHLDLFNGRYEQALDKFHKVWRFRTQQLPNDHANIGDTLSNLAITYDQMEQHEIASGYFKSYLIARQRVEQREFDVEACQFDVDHYTARTLVWYYRNMYFQKRKQEALRGLQCILHDLRFSGLEVAAHAAMCLGDISGDPAWYETALNHSRGLTAPLREAILLRNWHSWRPTWSHFCTWEAFRTLG